MLPSPHLPCADPKRVVRMDPSVWIRSGERERAGDPGWSCTRGKGMKAAK